MSGDRMVTILTVDFDCVLCLVTVEREWRRYWRWIWTVLCLAYKW